MKYGKILSKLRKDKKYSQPEVVQYINRHSSKSFTRAMISHWENGVALPPVEQFLLMCELYGVVDIQKTFRGIDSNIPNYTKLNKLGKSRVNEYVTMLYANPSFYDDPSSIVSEPLRKLRLFDLPASAGTGNYLDSDSYTEIEVDDIVPKSADFAIEVRGDSMIPRFIDGQIIYVKEQQHLEKGEIGVFAHNNESLIKKYGDDELISLNPEYPPIPITEFDNVRVFGKVVG
jgi:transcriptional regulator with XRE-family HTH domain